MAWHGMGGAFLGGTRSPVLSTGHHLELGPWELLASFLMWRVIPSKGSAFNPTDLDQVSLGSEGVSVAGGCS